MASQLTLSPAERPAYQYLWQLADPQQTGILLGDAAVAFFAKSKLSPDVLATVWTLSDSDNNGFLTPATFSIALRLIGHAQRGETVTEALANRPGPPPSLEGIQLPVQPGSGIVPQRNGTGFPTAVEIKPEDRARYTRIFASAGPQNGVLDGEKAKELFVRSKLPFDKLGAIWGLADTKSRGALDLTDFIIGMYFIQNVMNGSLNSIPAALPPGLYEQASGGTPSLAPGFAQFQQQQQQAQQQKQSAPQSPVPGSPIRAQNTGGIPRQMTGTPVGASPFGDSFASPGAGRPSMGGMPTSPNAMSGSGSLQPQTTGMQSLQAPFGNAPPTGPGAAAWDVSPIDKVNSDRFFDQLDVDKKGQLDGSACVPFFLQSKLQEPILAKIWDLSDHTSSGTLSKDEFAVAMHLINGQLMGRALPDALPHSLIPPSLRGHQVQQSNVPGQTDTQKDLFSLMDDDEIPVAPISTASAFVTPSASAPLGNRTVSAFQAPLQPQATGTSVATSTKRGPTAAGSGASGFDDDFFGAGTSTSPAPLSRNFTGASTQVRPSTTGTSTPLPSTSTPLPSIQQDLEKTGAQRTALETSIAQNSTSTKEMEDRLASVKETLATEQKLVKELEEKNRVQQEEIKKLREELIHEESSLSALKAEKDELEQALLKDREDVRDMKKKMAELQTQTTPLKTEIEKLKKDARQQKGMNAIAKKQLATAEADHEKSTAELTALQSGHGLEEPEPTTAAGTRAAPAALSPTASIKSSNPFDAYRTEGSHTPGAGAGLAAGAVAGVAAGAGTAAIAKHALSSESTSKAEAPAELDAFGVPVGGQAQPASTNSAFDDAFGAADPSVAAAADEQPPVSAVAPSQTGAAFDDSFGQDIATFDASTTPVPTTSAQPVAADSVFNDAFNDFGGSTALTATEVGSAGAANGFARDLGASEQPHAAGSSALAASALPVAAAASTQDKTPADDEDTSDEEEEGPEDLDGPRQMPAPLSSVTGPAASSAFNEEDPDKTVFGVEDKAKSAPAEEDASFASATGGVPVASSIPGYLAPEHETSSQPASVDGDAFHDASDGDISPPQSSAVPVAATSGADSSATRSPSTSVRALGSDAASTSTKTRRAPPPAPARSGSINTPAAATGAAVPSAAAASDFGDDNFVDAPAGLAAHPAAATSSKAPQEAAFDDFEAAFDDLGPAVPASGATNGTAKAATGFDDNAFDSDFSFVPSFPTGGAAAAGSSSRAAPQQAASDAFADFDSSFGGSTKNAAATSATAAPSSNIPDFDFDNAFEPVNAPSSSSGRAAAPTGSSTAYAAPSLPPRSSRETASAPPPRNGPSPALADDAGQVKQLTQMGFGRNQVIHALEKSNYRTDKALERLLAGK